MLWVGEYLFIFLLFIVLLSKNAIGHFYKRLTKAYNTEMPKKKNPGWRYMFSDTVEKLMVKLKDKFLNPALGSDKCELYDRLDDSIGYVNNDKLTYSEMDG